MSGTDSEPSEHEDFFRYVQDAALDYVRLSDDNLKEVVATVLVDFWTLLHEEPKKAREVLTEYEDRRRWVRARLSTAYRLLIYGERRAYRSREVELSFDPSDHRRGIEAVEARIALRNLVSTLSEKEALTLGALLVSYVLDQSDYQIAEALEISPSSFHERKAKLLVKVKKALYGQDI